MPKLLVSVTILPILVAAASGMAFAQTYPATPPAQQTPPTQTAPAQAPASPTAPGQPTKPAPAQTPSSPSTQPTPGQTPSVHGLKAFSAEADFMSLPGYLRYLMHQQTGQWVTYSEAKRMAQQQGAL